jgi:hypothetical protein
MSSVTVTVTVTVTASAAPFRPLPTANRLI